MKFAKQFNKAIDGGKIKIDPLISSKNFYNEYKNFLERELLESFKQKTDLDRFIELYKSLGINCVVSENEEKQLRIYLVQEDHYDIFDGKDTRSDLFGGYGLFYSEIRFTKDGEFIGQFFWE